MNNRMITFLSVACGLVLSSWAEDLTVPAGETFVLSESATYESVTVSGTLEVADGVQLTAANVALGPNAGDIATLRVLGGIAESLKVTGTVTVGANGGTGKIVALEANSSSTKVINLVYLTVSASAAVTPGSACIDVLELGTGICDLKTFKNESATTARLIVDGGSLGSSQYWGASRFVGGFRIEGATLTSKISFKGDYTKYVLNNGPLTIANCGDVSFTGSANADSDIQYKEISAGLSWENAGDLILASRNRMNIVSDDVLPYGSTCGSINAEANGTWIDVHDHTVKINGLRSQNPIRGAIGGAIVFGTGNTDGVLAASVTNAVSISKVGSGTLTVTGASSAGSFVVSEGVLKLTAPLTVESLDVAEGATLELDGQVLAPAEANVRGTVILKNGARLLTTLDTETGARFAGLGYQGDIEKTGAGCYIIEDPAVISTNVHVKAGTLAFSAEGYVCKLFRWNVKGWNNVGWMDKANGASENRFYLAELAFVGTDGARVGKNLSTAANGTAPGTLSPGSACFPEGTCFATNATGRAGSLFDSNQFPRISIESPLTTDEGGVELYVRLPDDAASVSAINFAANWGGFPKAWTLSGSPDGGATWTVLNETTAFVPTTDESERWIGSDGGKYTEPVPKAFPFNSANLHFANAGVRNMPEKMEVEVDFGATLDFGNVTGGQTVNALTLDCTNGGGTLVNAVFAAKGLLRVTNVPEGHLSVGLEVPCVLTNPKDVRNLKSWDVTDGQVSYPMLRPTYDSVSHTIKFARAGLVLVIR